MSWTCYRVHGRHELDLSYAKASTTVACSWLAFWLLVRTKSVLQEPMVAQIFCSRSSFAAISTAQTENKSFHHSLAELWTPAAD